MILTVLSRECCAPSRDYNLAILQPASTVGTSELFTRTQSKEKHLILEIAEINIKDGMSETFEKGVAKARPVILSAEGCHGVSLHRSVEYPLRYRLMVQWDSIENHTVTFRASEGFKVWRGLVQNCFAGMPSVGHVKEVIFPE